MLTCVRSSRSATIRWLLNRRGRGSRCTVGHVARSQSWWWRAIGAALLHDRAVRPRARRAHGRADGRRRARRSTHGGRRTSTHAASTTTCWTVRRTTQQRRRGRRRTRGAARPPILIHPPRLRRGQAPTSRRYFDHADRRGLWARTRSTTALSRARSDRARRRRRRACDSATCLRQHAPRTARCAASGCSNTPIDNQPDAQHA